MTPRSKISRLPSTVRDKIAELHNEGLTIDEIMAHLQQLDLPPGRLPHACNLSRYVKRLDVMAAEVQQSRDIAKIIVDRLGDAPETRQARLNIELMHGAITEIFFARAAQKEEEEGHSATLSPAQAYLLAKSLALVTHAERTDQNATFNLRTEIAAEQNRRVEAAAKAVAKVAKEEGLSAERVAMLQAKIAGLRIQTTDDR